MADREEDVKKVELVMEVSEVKDEEADDDDDTQEGKLPVNSPGSLFATEGWSEQNDMDISYSRMAIPEHAIPTHKVIDAIIAIARDIGNGSGVFFCR